MRTIRKRRGRVSARRLGVRRRARGARSRRRGRLATSLNRAAGAPLYALSQLDEPVPVLHLCAQGGPGEALRARGVRYVFVKGLPCSLALYENPLDRLFRDVDVCVGWAELSRACRALSAAGFVEIRP